MSADFIEIKEGISVNCECIEAIIEINDPKKPTTMCKVYTANNSYPSTLTRKAILQIINNEKEDEESVSQKAFNILKQQQNFAG